MKEGGRGGRVVLVVITIDRRRGGGTTRQRWQLGRFVGRDGTRRRVDR
jgi:hypothetical protein